MDSHKTFAKQHDGNRDQLSERSIIIAFLDHLHGLGLVSARGQDIMDEALGEIQRRNNTPTPDIVVSRYFLNVGGSAFWDIVMTDYDLSIGKNEVKLALSGCFPFHHLVMFLELKPNAVQRVVRQHVQDFFERASGYFGVQNSAIMEMGMVVCRFTRHSVYGLRIVRSLRYRLAPACAFWAVYLLGNQSIEELFRFYGTNYGI
ncbi:hypothetical protein DACRYDRAFT_19292 [Dacryopinax primogenitus]|uniref:Uncharacterized protein n=1 Tax=Dacryopinax primogenitus (strain DJM 731) TaxID=1858805 RepID=M5FY48_DACPD|nr:uncharacterized protein DACRYDRAFT_19292 [Dacryopinax primogenitus]EJT96467.1 hypothetical protein DACRYDRAFT_19292 [Dacryopinax primogenitus]